MLQTEKLIYQSKAFYIKKIFFFEVTRNNGYTFASGNDLS